ncbi:MAG: respiratory nitrate reductase subunit gamma [Pseudomonadota bacterium]|nr:MAG: respiratory nitrate reductase subunit gamma [Pseudomonadota bacterium]
MSAMSIIYALLFYVATFIFVAGVGYKIYVFARTPQPLKIPTTPAPITYTGVALRMVREVTLFESLFKSNKWTWLFGWIFHLSLLLAFIRHLRYVLTPDNVLWPIINLELVQTAGKYAGYAMLLGLAGLLARRFVVDRVRYISSPSDYLMLLLLLTIAGSGLLMTFVSHVDIIALKGFVLGLLLFEWQLLPASPFLLIHLTLVALLMIIFPFSKLLHAPGVFFSPTRNQRDNPREQRHVAGWSAQIDNTKSADAG